MKKLLSAVAAIVLLGVGAVSREALSAVPSKPAKLPTEVYVDGKQFHVQGIAYDKTKDCMYMSFTSAFYKTDMKGNVVASISGINGHLGAMTFDPVGRKVYASLEFKDDSIGRGVSNGLGAHLYTREQCVFYIACIDVDKVVRMDMMQDEAITLYRVEDACNDYQAKVMCNAVEYEHRFACSGIDGITIGPAFGTNASKVRPGKDYKRYLYVAYGIYGDSKRPDDDYNILLCYELEHPEKPVCRYFIRTGNTSWGVQNLGYDRFTNKLFMAVYKGDKPQYPNYSLFALNMSQKPFKDILKGVPYHKEKELQLRTDQSGLYDADTDIGGWNFKWGSTGFCPLGDGYYYISENGKYKDDEGRKCNFCRATLYRWTGEDDGPFERVAQTPSR